MRRPVTHFVVKDSAPPGGETVVVGRLYELRPPAPEVREDVEEEREAKVVRRGRRPKVRACEEAETK